uniref:Uncharacterized protein n=1 Tax=Streptomyces avermitilis TaxID=33903 RepID=A0A499VZ12_STRAX|nr:hypothetical protein SAVMC3_58050 [Streptomyces avermitilis]
MEPEGKAAGRLQIRWRPVGVTARVAGPVARKVAGPRVRRAARLVRSALR